MISRRFNHLRDGLRVRQRRTCRVTNRFVRSHAVTTVASLFEGTCTRRNERQATFTDFLAANFSVAVVFLTGSGIVRDISSDFSPRSLLNSLSSSAWCFTRYFATRGFASQRSTYPRP